MAKTKLNVFQTTGEAHPGDNSDLDEGIIKATGLGMREGEIEAIRQIAARLEVTPNAIKRFAIRDFIMRYREGLIDLSQFIETPPPPKKKLEYPAHSTGKSPG